MSSIRASSTSFRHPSLVKPPRAALSDASKIKRAVSDWYRLRAASSSVVLYERSGKPRIPEQPATKYKLPSQTNFR